MKRRYLIMATLFALILAALVFPEGRLTFSLRFRWEARSGRPQAISGQAALSTHWRLNAADNRLFQTEEP